MATNSFEFIFYQSTISIDFFFISSSSIILFPLISINIFSLWNYFHNYFSLILTLCRCGVYSGMGESNDSLWSNNNDDDHWNFPIWMNCTRCLLYLFCMVSKCCSTLWRSPRWFDHLSVQVDGGGGGKCTRLIVESALIGLYGNE